MDYSAHSDNQELIARLRVGDQQAFRQLYDQHWKKLYTIAYNRLKSKEVAEELVQDVFTSLWARREALAITSSISAYLTTAIKYAILNHIDGRSVRKQYKEWVSQQSEAVDNSTEEHCSANELRITLNKHVQTLPEKCRQVFTLSREKHLSVKEIAEHLQLSPKTVEAHMGKALRTLRVRLSDFLFCALLLFF